MPLFNPTTSNPYKFGAYRAAAANSGNAAFLQCVFDTKEFDTNTNYSTSTGNYTVPVAGFYQFNWGIELSAAAQDFVACLYKNGVEFRRGLGRNNANTSKTSGGAGFLQLAANDTIGVYVFAGATTALNIGQAQCYLNGYLVSIT